MGNSMKTAETKSSISRRTFFSHAAAPLALAAFSRTSLANISFAPQCKMGIASTSFMGAEIGAGPVAGTQGGTPPARPRARDAFEFLEKCHALGAGGIQTQLNGDIAKLRARAEEL